MDETTIKCSNEDCKWYDFTTYSCSRSEIDIDMVSIPTYMPMPLCMSYCSKAAEERINKRRLNL